ncbi:DUF1045 domain-containing protein [Ensifer sp. 4252]|uniref:DUF1045 domain-containing protein n=1 Tax=Ensifer sp. 4252 TaxID=3373915 RepID=UPI003D22DAB9
MRYAIYFAPPADDRLSQTAARWLGRDAFTDETNELPALGGLDADTRHALTADPRRYGFHGTLKAPFTLAEGRSEAELVAAFEEFAADLEPFELPELTLHQLGPFFALVSATHCAALQDFAAQAVQAFEPFRAPLSDVDMARRSPDKLPDRQREYLKKWGYPYVFEEFQFHLTLTGPVPGETAETMRTLLGSTFAEYIGKPLHVASVALFVEPHRGAPFLVHSLLPLGGATQRKIA